MRRVNRSPWLWASLALIASCKFTPHAVAPDLSPQDLLSAPSKYEAPIIRVRGYYLEADYGLEIAGMTEGIGFLFETKQDAEVCNLAKALLVIPHIWPTSYEAVENGYVLATGRFQKPHGSNEFHGVLALDAPLISLGGKGHVQCLRQPPPPPPEPH